MTVKVDEEVGVIEGNVGIKGYVTVEDKCNVGVGGGHLDVGATLFPCKDGFLCAVRVVLYE